MFKSRPPSPSTLRPDQIGTTEDWLPSPIGWEREKLFPLLSKFALRTVRQLSLQTNTNDFSQRASAFSLSHRMGEGRGEGFCLFLWRLRRFFFLTTIILFFHGTARADSRQLYLDALLDF